MPRTVGETERDAQLLATLRRVADAMDAIHGTLAAFLDLANGACGEVAAAPRGAVPGVPPVPDVPPQPLEYSGKGQIVNPKTGELVSPRAVVGAYNAMRDAIWGPMP